MENLDLNVTDDDIDCVMQNVADLAVCGLRAHDFKMQTWGDFTGCGTAACAWGSAFFKRNGQLATSGPCMDWWNESRYRRALRTFFRMSFLLPKSAQTVYRSINKETGLFNIGFLRENLPGPVYQEVYEAIPSSQED